MIMGSAQHATAVKLFGCGFSLPAGMWTAGLPFQMQQSAVDANILYTKAEEFHSGVNLQSGLLAIFNMPFLLRRLLLQASVLKQSGKQSTPSVKAVLPTSSNWL